MIKVAYFTHASNLTGANRSLLELFDSLEGWGVVPVVFLRENGPIEQELKTREIKYYILPYKSWFHDMRTKKNMTRKAKYVLREWYNAALAKRAAQILKKEEVQLIHSNTMLIGFGGQVAKAAGLPHVWHMREFMEEDHHFSFDNEKKVTRRLRQATALIAISEVIAVKFSERLGCDVEMIYDVIDTEKYTISDKKILTKPKTDLMIAGRIVEAKGQMEAVQAIALLKVKKYNVYLRIIGNGTAEGELEKIQRYIKKNNLEDMVECIPFQKDLSFYNHSCDIQLVCSHSEAFGRVTIEGMLAHSLVIGADAGCTSYLIKDGENGLLYTCGDPKSLADKIEWAINNKEQTQAIAEAGYDWGRGFTKEKTAEKIVQLYKKIS